MIHKSNVCIRTILFLFLATVITQSTLQGIIAKKIDKSRHNEVPVYQQLTKWQYSAQSFPIPDGGVTFTRDNAIWTLEQGQVWLMEPTADGKITGLIFEGQGRFRMTIPYWVEKEQLRRCSGKKDAGDFDETFNKLIIRTPEPLLNKLFQDYQPQSYTSNDFASARHKVWFKLANEDVDARVTAGLFNPDDQFLWIEMKTETYSWLTYIFDKYQLEEIKVKKFKRKFEFVETWVSLDRDSQRHASGRTNSVPLTRIDIQRIVADADLTKIKMKADYRDTAAAIFNTKVTFVALEDQLQVIQLGLQDARIESVRTADGTYLPFIRKSLGKSFLSKKDDLHFPVFWIFLDKPCAKGEKREVEVNYEWDMLNFASGGSWYPSLHNNSNDRYIFQFNAKTRENSEVRAVGECVNQSVEGKYKISQWQTKEPIDLYAFTIGKSFREKKLKVDGIPEVVVFGENWLASATMLKNVAADVANCLNFYKQVFGIQYPYKSVQVTAVEGWFGQAMDGLLQLSKHTFESEHPGATELFRGHETAHLLWGHMVGPKTYRDYWLSESFAEYSAMLYVQAVMPKKKHFDNIIEGYRNELLGSLKTIFSKYSWPFFLVGTKRDRDKIGPISVGFRASVADSPLGYQIQSYHKGSLVLHMLRMIMRNATGNDRFFFSVMKEFLHTYKGKLASTEDFKSIIEKRTKSDWSWFFDQWVHGTAIPTYSWDYKVSKKDSATGKYNMTITVKQSDVPKGFRMPVPLQVFFKDGSVKQYNLPINKPEQSYNMAFPQKVKKVIFNPSNSVLAKMKRG